MLVPQAPLLQLTNFTLVNQASALSADNNTTPALTIVSVQV
jgi:hypothetical protein